MNRHERRWRQFIVAIAAMASVGVFMLPYRGVLLSDQPLPTELQGWRSPIARIVDELLSEHHIRNNVYLSNYDELFREVSTPHNIHWCFVSAMAYTESRFDPNAVSSSGAIGLLQIMPHIGRSLGVRLVDLYNPRINVQCAIKHILDIERMLSLPANISERDRLSLILAGYNGGIGRVFDAQRLARLVGYDPHKWSDVRRCLLMLRQEEWYTNEVVRYGSFKMAHYTVGYVRNVLNKYDEYLESTDGCSYHLYPHALHYDRLSGK